MIGMRRTKQRRYERELARLTEASTDLADKTMALQELEAVLIRERETAQELGRQVGYRQKDYVIHGCMDQRYLLAVVQG